MKKLLFLSFFLLSVVSAGIISSPKTYALSGSDFQAGRIIDDGVFFNPTGLDPGNIQGFLNSKVPSCDTNGTQAYGGTTRAAYAASRGYPAPFTCLRNYSENTPTKPAESGLCNQYNGGTKSAAQIIYDVGQACGINPKVMIVLLEKEQSLVTDDWPWSIQYRSATGYGCPDTAACDSTYYGFFNQVYNAGRQFKRYGRDASIFGYRAGRDNYIQYNPNAGCGGTNVYIQNQATAGLYNFTPYQPNASALANLYGTGDGCGAYGNRNFWRIFNDWFGSTQSNMSTSNIDWRFEELDGQSTAVSQTAGTFGSGSYTVQVGSVLHTFYYDTGGSNLKHSWADGTGWHFETLDGDGGISGRTANNVGQYVKGTLFNNKLYLAYYDATTGNIRLATWDNSSWIFEDLDGGSTTSNRINANVGQDISITGFGNTLQVFYSDVTGGNLRHAWYSNSTWSFENLDGATNSVSGNESFTGQAIKASEFYGSLQLFYYDGQLGNLKHAWADGRGWHFEHLDGDDRAISRTEGNVGGFIGFMPYYGSLQLFYYDFGKGNLKHAWADGRGWHFEHLDGDDRAISRTEGNVGYRPEVASLGQKLYVFYGSPDRGYIKQSWADGTGWHFAEVDGSFTGVSRNGSHPLSSYMSVIPFGDNLQMFYFDDYSKALRHAWGPSKY